MAQDPDWFRDMVQDMAQDIRDLLQVMAGNLENVAQDLRDLAQKSDQLLEQVPGV